MKDWLTVNELARIQGVTPRAIRKGVANNKYVVRQVNGKKGLMYEIFVPAISYKDIKRIPCLNSDKSFLTTNSMTFI